MEELTKKEVELFDAIIEVYKENPALAMSCINEKNKEKFSLYLHKQFSKQKLMSLEYKEIINHIKSKKKVLK